ncbi:methyl-accepting chemotaxis protein [Paraburkholderia sp. BR10872]|uniref:methyl-accepting chemotaxis protein n=1 Tax=Paraburkholderia sp. BR10872 TaxID=3236989 RepID=UPI0034D299C4
MESTGASLRSLYARADKLMIVVIWGLFVISCLLAENTFTWGAVAWIGLPAVLSASALVRWHGGTLLTRLCIAASLMTFAALQIYQERGLTAMHFGVFVLMAFLLAYRDWRPVVCAAIVIALHHVTFNYLQIAGLNAYCFTRPALSAVFLHAGYVVAEAGLLIVIARRMEIDALTGRELALLGEMLSHEEDKFDLRLAPMTLKGVSSRTFKNTLDAIHRALQQVTGIVGRMAESSEDIAAENRLLFEQIATQASGLKQTNIAIVQIADRIRSSAEHAASANSLAKESSAVAHQSGKVVSEVVSNMGEIEAAVQRMGDMIATIEGIAFQTNILALNAAVEAARAGTSGRGFAVVASEVRTLAQRSASAASDVRRLIVDSLGKVDQGAVLARRAGQAMEHVVETVGSVARLIEQVSSASDAQSSDVNQFSRGVDEMDTALEVNVDHVKKVAQTSESLNEQAQKLRSAISAFLVEPAEMKPE